MIELGLKKSCIITHDRAWPTSLFDNTGRGVLQALSHKNIHVISLCCSNEDCGDHADWPMMITWASSKHLSAESMVAM